MNKTYYDKSEIKELVTEACLAVIEEQLKESMKESASINGTAYGALKLKEQISQMLDANGEADE